MANDAFTAGVEPGGLTSHSEIKILICYILRYIASPVTTEELVNTLTEKGLANYFELTSAVSELVESGHVSQAEDSYTLRETGWQIADMLSSDLPLMVRVRAVEAVKDAMELTRKRRQNLVEIVERDNGYDVRCSIVDDAAGPLYSFTIYAPTRKAAQTIRDNFIDKAEQLLRQDLTLLTGESL